MRISLPVSLQKVLTAAGDCWKCTKGSYTCKVCERVTTTTGSTTTIQTCICKKCFGGCCCDYEFTDCPCEDECTTHNQCEGFCVACPSFILPLGRLEKYKKLFSGLFSGLSRLYWDFLSHCKRKNCHLSVKVVFCLFVYYGVRSIHDIICSFLAPEDR